MIHTAGAFLLRDGAVLLARRALHKRSYAGCWDVIGGHVEPGETIEQALIREVAEEIGVTPRHHRHVASLHDERHGATYHLFVVEDWAPVEPVLLGDEHSELRWFPIAEACGLSRLALPAYAAILHQLGERRGVTAAPDPQ
ncbi:NUDIX domain-containing protein [Sphingomonas adhaesiva]|uniref:NUDIX domain-containing protein n=1 Tax=Sphingomonas adhaesiva TaxID=28212 RepID=UPI002FFA27D4